MKLILLFSLMISGVALASPGSLRPFSSDGCSSWPDGTYMDPEKWQDCCITHDISYWMGGTSEEKDEADEAFKQCVNGRKAGMGFITYAGVRVGGSPKLPTSWRWGYGWPQGRGYKKLTLKEKQEVADELDATCLYGKEVVLIHAYMEKKKIPMQFQKLRQMSFQVNKKKQAPHPYKVFNP